VPPATTTTLAPLPATLPITVDEWEWQRIALSGFPGDARYNGTYLAYETPGGGPVIATNDWSVVLEHERLDESEWIVQDIELGDHWLAIVENTEGAGSDQGRLVVYDLRTGDVALERLYAESDGWFSLPSISISGLYVASTEAENPNCITVDNLEHDYQVDEICVDDPVLDVELDGLSLAYETRDDECRSSWTTDLYRPEATTELVNRECWSNAPASGEGLAVWFESPVSSSGIDTILGLSETGDMVGLGQGARGFAEICWGTAFWRGGNRDIRMWDGGDSVATIIEADSEWLGVVSCVGPWITVADPDGILIANSLTQSPAAACDVCDQPDSAREAQMADGLAVWVHDRFEELPAELEASVSDVVGQDGWWIGHGGFSSHLEGALFVWDPNGNITIAWSGSADSEYDIREYMISTLPDAPAAMLGCVDLDGYY